MLEHLSPRFRCIMALHADVVRDVIASLTRHCPPRSGLAKEPASNSKMVSTARVPNSPRGTSAKKATAAAEKTASTVITDQAEQTWQNCKVKFVKTVKSGGSYPPDAEPAAEPDLATHRAACVATCTLALFLVHARCAQ